MASAHLAMACAAPSLQRAGNPSGLAHNCRTVEFCLLSWVRVENFLLSWVLWIVPAAMGYWLAFVSCWGSYLILSVEMGFGVESAS